MRLWGKPGAKPEVGADGADGNAALTGAVGLVLLVVLFLEGITILEVRQLITLHIFVGLLLIPPTALKLGSTTYRFARYYRRSPAYLRHGPPAPLLRWTAPLLVVLTGAVLLTGVALLVVGPEGSGRVLGLHKASFVIWFALMALHVLGHLKGAVFLSLRDWSRDGRARPAGAPRGRGLRRGLVLVSLTAGFALALALLPAASPWTDGPARHDDGAGQVGQSVVNVRESLWP